MALVVIVRHLDWNEAHIARHGFWKEDVEQACHRQPQTQETHGGRILMVGPNDDGNLIAVVLSPLSEPGAYYPVTARPASKKERREYRRWLESQPE